MTPTRKRLAILVLLPVFSLALVFSVRAAFFGAPQLTTYRLLILNIAG